MTSAQTVAQASLGWFGVTCFVGCGRASSLASDAHRQDKEWQLRLGHVDHSRATGQWKGSRASWCKRGDWVVLLSSRIDLVEAERRRICVDLEPPQNSTDIDERAGGYNRVQGGWGSSFCFCLGRAFLIVRCFSLSLMCP